MHMAKHAEIKKLINKDLKGFRTIEMTEVYRVDNDGRKSESIGVFKNPDVAQAFAGVQTGADWHHTKKILVLTDGTVGYNITEVEPVTIFSDESELVKVKEKALAKLSPAERRILKL
jgi:hypothetical protein